jgi:DNA-binding CsgD family transcriptional regulator
LPVVCRAVELTGRDAERRVLDRLVGAVRAGNSRALVVHGEPGVGKTALLEYLAEHAPGCRVARAGGVQSEMELAFAGLHQLCAPLLGWLEAVPAPQRDALQTAFGLRAGPAADRFLVGLAVLSLLSAVAEERPLVCLVDDGQWLDHASRTVLAFVARRLGAESVGLVLATRVAGGDLAGLPELEVTGLGQAAARALLAAALPGPIDGRVCDQIVAETGGNPLALLELPRGLTQAELAGGFGLPGAAALAGSIEASFGRRVGALPPQSRRLLLLAAADPTGDPVLVWRAAARLGIGAEAAAPVAEAGLAEFGTRVWFRHPLARSAAYRLGSAQERREAHGALAAATDPRLDPDRRAWHRAQAAPWPDEDVAAELERSAGRAQARGGVAASAAFLQRAVALTVDPSLRAGRALAAAQAQVQAGAFDAARDLLAMAESGPLSDFQQASADLMRAQLAFNTSRGTETTPLLLAAARRLEPLDLELAREAYLDAFTAALFAAQSTVGVGLSEVAQAARAVPRRSSDESTAGDLLLDALVELLTGDHDTAALRCRAALRRLGADTVLPAKGMRWLWLGCAIASDLWDDDSWYVLSSRHLQMARETGALSELPHALNSFATILVFCGDLPSAASLLEEGRSVQQATGISTAPYAALSFAAWRGQEAVAREVIEVAIREAGSRGEGWGVAFSEYTHALLCNGLGEYDEALVAAGRAREYSLKRAGENFALPELIESATRTGRTDLAADALGRLARKARASGTDWALGVEARSRALLSEGDTAEGLFSEAIERLGRTRMRVDLARAHLLYGEWLRRERRRCDARERLRAAHRMLEEIGAEAFAERARRELLATGERVRKRTVATSSELTAQEAQIARLAREGLSNPEIGTRLFISAHTVQYHLRKVFAKLAITSRSQLDRVLPAIPASAGRTG